MKKGLALAVVPVLAVAVVLFLQTRIGYALIKSRSHFVALGSDGRILYEPGAEARAERISLALDEAIGAVERGHFLPFVEPFTVYVCATQESFNEYLGAPASSPVRGTALRYDILLAPAAFASPFGIGDTSEGVLAHELSHLHLKQRLGVIGVLWRLPVWFQEGLACVVSGAGGEIVSDAAAASAILDGEYFLPDDRGTYFKIKRSTDYGIKNPQLFYKESKLFVSYIMRRDPRAFGEFLVAIQRGEPFGPAFSRVLKVDVTEMWEEFTAALHSSS
jgi:hypothetical protein